MVQVLSVFKYTPFKNIILKYIYHRAVYGKRKYLWLALDSRVTARR